LKPANQIKDDVLTYSSKLRKWKKEESFEDDDIVMVDAAQDLTIVPSPQDTTMAPSSIPPPKVEVVSTTVSIYTTF